MNLWAQSKITNINYGDCFQSSLSLSGEIDTYMFTGNKDDIITVRMGWISGSFSPQIEVYAPNGSLLKRVDDLFTARIDTLRLPASGFFSVLAMDRPNGTRTGDYGLSLQRTFNTGKATAITYGATVQDTILISGCMNAYTFLGNKGDVITVRMAWTSGSLSPQVEVYAPNGSLLKRADELFTARIDTLRLPALGTYEILAMDRPNGSRTGVYAVSLAGIRTDVKEQPMMNLPLAFELRQNYPNPFNAMTTIRYLLPKSTHVMMRVYDILGQKVAELVDEEKQAGAHQLQFNAGNLSNGLYFCRLQTAEHNITQKLRILK
jgi:hypothetical protein